MNVLFLQLLEKKVRLESERPQALQAMAALFAPCEAAADVDLSVVIGDCADAGGRLWFDVHCTPADAFVGMETEKPLAPLSLARTLCAWAARLTTDTYVFHGAALALEQRGLLVIGESGCGKTTLTLSLLRRGWSFYSDEVAALRLADARLVPFARRPVVRCDVWPHQLLGPFPDLPLEPAPLPHEQPAAPCDPARLGAAPRQPETEPVCLVFPRYSAGEMLTVHKLDQGSALLAMMAASCSQPVFKVRGLDFVIDIVRRLPAYVVTYGHADEAAAELKHLVGDVAL